MANVPAPEIPIHDVADALIEAHRLAIEDGDQQLLELIEAALLHVGRRLAAEGRKVVDPVRN